ncbi:EH domain-containing protein 1-like isoform X2 [Gossypium raimondii]|uniref:EH domain-containing protein 1-like isoform X2 n=1 Tax=Gossypium raimondii TaxID=29730 RepID=UPI00227D4C80|nr:EH domain-containing protein 1-like isoform X2 [Gossypium raimondii]
MVFFKIIKEGAHIGPEPMTNRFVVVMSGTDERSVPGNTIAVQADMPFSGLTTFGTAFLSKFECSQMPHLNFEKYSGAIGWGLQGATSGMEDAKEQIVQVSKNSTLPSQDEFSSSYGYHYSLQLNVSFRIGANGLENSLGKKVCGMHTSLENLFCFRTWIQLTLQQKWRI